MQENQQVIFLSDGADNVRGLQFIMHPESEHVLDWLHLTMRFTVLNQFAKGLVKTDSAEGNEVVTKRMVKKQQMQWSSIGAHYLLQARTATLNGELPNYFERWYPGVKINCSSNRQLMDFKKTA